MENIIYYINDRLNDPRIGLLRSNKLRRIEFESRSYEHSALMEIKMYLLKNKKRDVVTVLEEFRSKMDEFACKTTAEIPNFMFSTYYDVATDVLDWVITH